MSKRAAKPAPKAADTESKQRSQANLIPFVKGDRRINRRGRPKSFDALRKLAQEIVNEDLADSGLTRLQAMLMAMSTSRNPRDRELILQYGFGKVKDELEVIGRMSDDDLRKAIAARVGIAVSDDTGSEAARLVASSESGKGEEVPAADVAG